MAWRRTFVLECDECGVDEWDMWKGNLERQARRWGWRLGKARQLCPDCADRVPMDERGIV